MTNRSTRWGLGLLVLSILLIPQAANAQCSLASLTGTYNYLVEGVPGFTYGSGTGTLVADGAGNFTNVETDYSTPVPNPAFILVKQENSIGYYQINADCTGILIFHPSIPNRELIERWVNIVLVQGQTVFHGVGIDQGDFEGYTGTKQ